MATTYWLWQCTGTRGVATVPLSTNQYPTCSAGAGSWVQVEVEPPFHWDPALLNNEGLFSAFSAGFTVVAGLLLVVIAGRALLKASD